MKKIFFVVMAGCMFLLSSCGGEVVVDGGVVVSIPPPPVVYIPSITLVHYAPNQAYFGDGNGVVSVAGIVDFSDPDGDVTSMTMSVVDSHGYLVSQKVSSLPAFYGYTQGTVYFSIDFSTLVVDSYTFSVYLTDSCGNMSNPIFGTFRVCP